MKIRKMAKWACVGAALYFCLNYHVVYINKKVRWLKKSELSLGHIFVSTHGRSNETIMAIDELRKNGIGDLLVEEGLMTERKRTQLLSKYDEAPYPY